MTTRTEPGDCQEGSPNIISLPCGFADQLDERRRRQLNIVQIEFARESALLQSRTYEAILRILADQQTGG